MAVCGAETLMPPIWVTEIFGNIPANLAFRSSLNSPGAHCSCNRLLSLSSSMSPPEEFQWFAENLQPHEPAVRAYLASRFPWLQDQDDIVQESYSRVLRAQQNGPIKHARAFFFSTAHNAAIDLFRRKARHEHVAVTDLRELPVLEEAPGVGEIMDERQRHETLAEALASLPERCREVVRLRFQENLSYKEIAGRLGVTTDCVKVHLGRGIRRCAKFFASRELLRSGNGMKKAAS
jgi:RNA polymerase sigma-70 factor (ECF subfamily)